MTDQPDPLIGVLCGEYKIQDFIGAGGMGRVYRAQHEMLGKEVALKLLPTHVMGDEQYVHRFLREAKIAASLHHPSLVEVYDCGRSDHGHYIVMELVKGLSLGVVLESTGKLSEDQALDVAEASLSALAYAHEAGVVHRDIKPDNLLIREDGSLKLTDLGLAKASTVDQDAGLTQSGMVLGTPFYVSPEQIQGSKNVDGRTDLYSLGATLYHCVTGHRPFIGDTSAIIMNKHLNEATPNPKHRVQELTEETSLFIMRLMHKNPDYRFANAQDAITALQRIRGLKDNPNKKIDEVVFIEEPDWKDKLRDSALPVSVGILLFCVLGWFLWRHAKPKPVPVSIPTPEVVVNKNEPSQNPASVAGETPKEPVLPEGKTIFGKTTEPFMMAAFYQVQLPNVIKDGYFKGNSEDKIELIHSDVISLSKEQRAYFHFELPMIWNNMNHDLGQEPQIRRVDFVVVGRMASQSSGKIGLYPLTRSIEEGFSPRKTPLSEVNPPQNHNLVQLKFDVTEEVTRAIKTGENFGWCLMVDGDSEFVLASSQDGEKKKIPALIFGIGVRKELLPERQAAETAPPGSKQ